MFGKLPRTLVMSEPGALNYIHRLYNQGQFTWTEYERLIQSCTKLQFKPTRQTKTDRYVLNSQHLCVHLLTLLRYITAKNSKPCFLNNFSQFNLHDFSFFF